MSPSFNQKMKIMHTLLIFNIENSGYLRNGLIKQVFKALQA